MQLAFSETRLEPWFDSTAVFSNFVYYNYVRSSCPSVTQCACTFAMLWHGAPCLNFGYSRFTCSLVTVISS